MYVSILDEGRLAVLAFALATLAMQASAQSLCSAGLTQPAHSSWPKKIDSG
jgi:hypothetical protein